MLFRSDRLDEVGEARPEHVGMHAEARADRQDQRAERAERRSRAGIDQVIGMLGSAVGHVHPPFPVAPAATLPSKVFARSVFASKKVYESVMVRTLS